MYVLLVFSSQRFLNYFLVEYVLSKSVGVSFAYEFRVFAVKNFKSLPFFFWIQVTQKRRTNALRTWKKKKKTKKKKTKPEFQSLRSSSTFVSDFCISRRLLFHLSHFISFRSASCEARSSSLHFVSLLTTVRI